MCNFISPTILALVQDLTYVEFFAGEANVFKCIRADHNMAAAVDIRFMPNMPNSPMDILTDAGFLFFGSCKLFLFHPVYIWKTLLC